MYIFPSFFPLFLLLFELPQSFVLCSLVYFFLSFSYFFSVFTSSLSVKPLTIHFLRIFQVLYALLKDNHNHHQSPSPPPQHKALRSAHVALTTALLTAQASGSHALVTSSVLWLVLQRLEPQRATVAFLDILWVVNYLKKKWRVKIMDGKDDEEEEGEYGEDDTRRKEGKVEGGLIKNERRKEGKDNEEQKEKKHMEDDTKVNTGATTHTLSKDTKLAGKIRKANIQEDEMKKEQSAKGKVENKRDTNTPEIKAKEQAGEEGTTTIKYHKDEGKPVKKNAKRTDTKGIKSIHLWDIKSALEKARNGEEGKKLLQRKFEDELEETCYASSTLLLHGMLNARGKWVVEEKREENKEEEEEDYGGRAFLYSLHPFLLKLCSGEAAQHTYQAFQVNMI